MKLYKAGAVLLSVICCVSNVPSIVLAENAQGTEIPGSEENGQNHEDTRVQSEGKETKQNKTADNSKRGTLKSTDHSIQTNKISSEQKAAEKETTNEKQTANKKQETAVMTKEEEERQIPITSIGDFQKIGTEGYPLDGVYVLQNDIDGKDNESGENTVTEPLLKSEEPFTGVINGGGYTIANFNVKWAEEGDRNTSLFGHFSGRLEEISLLNIQVVSEKHSGALLAEKLDGAELKNIILSGKVILSDSEELSEEEQKQRKDEAIALQTDGKSWGEFLKSKEQKTKFTNVKSAVGLSDLSENLPKGLSKIETNPEYLSTVEGIEETIEAPKLEGFTFLSWRAETSENGAQEFEGEMTAPEELKTKITGKEGKYRLQAVYEYELKNVSEALQGEVTTNQNQTEIESDKTTEKSQGKHTAELILEVPYIVGKDIRNIEKLIPIDNVFPKQITAVMYLDAIDGVFPKYMEVGKKTEGETIAITSWEQFKNIGNTDYHSHYLMNANYVLEANIYSDGKAFTPIGTEENPFTGSFDGNGFEIDVSNNPEIDTSADYSGLFKVVKSQKQETDTEEAKKETEVKSEEEVKEER